MHAEVSFAILCPILQRLWIRRKNVENLIYYQRGQDDSCNLSCSMVVHNAGGMSINITEGAALLHTRNRN